VALAVLVGLAVTAPRWAARSAPERSGVCMDDWDVRDLVGFLEGRGLKLHLSPTWAGGNASTSAYLSTEAKPGAALYWLPKDPKAMQRWSGVVYCERAWRYEAREGVVEAWAENGLRAGPFVFFGDSALLARIRTALKDANDSSSRSCDP
jgi:hypothetical protein